MKVAILGCGAMGTVLGAYMTKNGCDVEMIDSYQAHVNALNQKGARIVGTVDFTVPVKAITRSRWRGSMISSSCSPSRPPTTRCSPTCCPTWGRTAPCVPFRTGCPSHSWQVMWGRGVP
jgi:2-dehydropantoate 2-reductase